MSLPGPGLLPDDEELLRRSAIARPETNSALPAITTRGLPPPRKSIVEPTPGSAEDLDLLRMPGNRPGPFPVYERAINPAMAQTGAQPPTSQPEQPRPTLKVRPPNDPLEGAPHLTPHIATPGRQVRGLRPQPTDASFAAPKMPLWEKIVSPLAIGAASWGHPETGAQLIDQFYQAPKREAEKRYEAAATAYDKQSEDELRESQTEKNRADAAAAEAGKVGTADTAVVLHDLMTGNNGQPRINPKTNQPYTYLEAYGEVKQAAQDTKPKTHPPVGADSAAQYNASILRELGVNPKTKVDKIPPEYEVKETDNDAQAKEKLQRAKDLVSGATGQQHISIDTGKPAAAEAAQVEREARAAIRKAGTEYRATEKSVAQLQAAIDQASDGNGLLTSFVPTMEVLGINTANGVHRISPAEAHAAQVPGGWAEQFNAWFDKATSGKVSPELKAEGKALANILLTTAHQQYKNIYEDEAGTVEGYGVKDFRKRVPQIQEPPHEQKAARTVKIHGQDIALAEDGTFQYQGHTYKDKGDGTGATLVK